MTNRLIKYGSLLTGGVVCTLVSAKNGPPVRHYNEKLILAGRAVKNLGDFGLLIS